MAAPIYPMQRSFYPYISDDTTTYEIATTVENGTTINGGTPQEAGTDPTYPRGWVPRRIQGVFVDSGSGKVYRTHVPILDPANTKWVGSVTTFSKGGETFNIQGRIGERRTYKGG